MKKFLTSSEFPYVSIQDARQKVHEHKSLLMKPQRSVNRLRSSIENFPAMKNPDFLDNEKLEAIAAVLATASL
jgi:hypothetical protein